MGGHARPVFIDVDGWRLATYSRGEGAATVLLLNGGPGLPCDCLREPLAPLASRRLRVVAFDQLGTGASDRPDDPALWTIERYAREVEGVRRALGLGRVHLLGQSWGGWLAIEYAVTFPDRIASLVLSSTCADIPHFSGELGRMRAALGPETCAMMAHREALGQFDHPEYQAAITILNHRHVCRLHPPPRALQASVDGWNESIYRTMQGPNEFLFTGNLKHWSRLDELAGLTVPCLIVAGADDELGPACARRMLGALPHARLEIVPDCTHGVIHERTDRYLAIVATFLAEQRT